MPQPRLLVPTTVVRSLVNDFKASKKGYCSNFRPFEIGFDFHILPEVRPGHVDYHQASRVLDNHECCKLTGHCNTWTPWMRHRLREAKVKDAPGPAEVADIRLPNTNEYGVVPCPHCGSAKREVFKAGQRHWVECFRCGYKAGIKDG